MSTRQLITLSLIIAVSTAENIWKGPPANHVLGELVEDTPEVAEAKRNHAAFFAQVRSLLPELPSEDDEHGIPQVHNFPQHSQYIHPVVTTYRPVAPFTLPPLTAPPVPLDPFNPTPAPWTGPFADHKLGQLVRETPAVALARKHHEEVFSRVRATLPELPPDVEEDRPVVDVYQRMHHVDVPRVSDYEAAAAHLKTLMEQIALHQRLQAQERFTTTTAAPFVQSVNWNSLPVDTPEVAAAKAAHARALAAVLGH